MIRRVVLHHVEFGGFVDAGKQRAFRVPRKTKEVMIKRVSMCQCVCVSE